MKESSLINYYQEWNVIRTLSEEEIFLSKENTIISIESSAWNLNVCVLDYQNKKYFEYNRPYILPLEPVKISEYQKIKLSQILEDIEKVVCKNKPINFVYCRGPGLAPSLNSVLVFYTELVKRGYYLNPKGVFHGTSHFFQVYHSRRDESLKKKLFCYYSGGSTQFIDFTILDKPVILKQTIDLTIGNLIDLVCRNAPYFSKSYLIKVSEEEIQSCLDEVIPLVSKIRKSYFNFSGYLKIFLAKGLPFLYAFIIRFTDEIIREIDYEEVFFSGGVFNSLILKRMLVKIKKQNIRYNFEDQNSDNAFMHVLSYYHGSYVEKEVNYEARMRICNDYSPLNSEVRYNLPSTLGDFLQLFSKSSIVERRQILDFLNKSNLKIHKVYLRVLSYRRHLPKL
jgi:tRNA A37 threonylcarbamoyltransferase TsaD